MDNTNEPDMNANTNMGVNREAGADITMPLPSREAVPWGIEAQKKKEIQLEKKEVTLLSVCGLGMAALYSLCFTGANVLPMLSLVVFMAVLLPLFYLMLKKLNYLVNKKAFWLAVPIGIITLFNGIFEYSILTYLNISAIWMLFLAMSVSAVSGAAVDFDSVSFWHKILGALPGEWGTGYRIFFRSFPRKGGAFKGVFMRVLMGIMLALPVAGIVLLLLMSGDGLFDLMVRRFSSSLVGLITSANIRLALHASVIALATGYGIGYVYHLKHIEEAQGWKDKLSYDVVVICTFLGILNVVFAAFCAVQLMAVSGFDLLKAYNVSPMQLSRFARSGFFELLFVTVINFSVIIILLKGFGSCIAHRWVKMLLMLLSGFTAVLIASSFHRMYLYIAGYGYTPMRVMVLTFLAMEAVMTAITLYYLLKPGERLIQYYMAVGLVFFIAVNILASGPRIAKMNIDMLAKSLEKDFIIDVIELDGAAQLIQFYHSDALNNPPPENRNQAEHVKEMVYERIHLISYGLERNQWDSRWSRWQNQSFIRFYNTGKVQQFFE